MSTVSAGNRHRGFTLVELLVVIAIIGMLVGILLPAVQVARESARRTQCGNNLRQLGLALQNYHDTLGAFPPAYIVQPKGGGIQGPPDEQTRDAGPGWAWGALLLPYLEGQAVSQGFDYRRPCWDEVNAETARTTIAAFLCPSASGDPLPFEIDSPTLDQPAKFARCHYVASVGQDETWGYTLDDYSQIADGPLYRNSRTRAAHVTDGLSNTVFLGEHHPVLSSKTWVGVVPGAMVCPTPQFAFSACDYAATLVQAHSGPAASEVPPAIHPPNSPMCHVCQMYAEHPGGAMVMLGDASVRFVSEFINQATWAALSSRAMNDIVGDF
jgi:prepilin-type N-terminal cleavage/methylation domain-containing protein